MTSGRTSRLTRLLATVAGAALALTACGGTTGSTSAPTKVGPLDPKTKVEITWWHGQSAEAAAILAKLAREYEKDHPNVTINDSAGASSTDELLQKMQAGLASNTYPDVSYAFGSWAGKLAQSGRTLDIADLVKKDGSGWTEFPEAARLTAEYKGKVMGFPAVVDNLGLLYNKDLFDKAGVAYPNADWTWDDFRAAAKEINNPAEKISGTAYPVAPDEGATWRLWPQVWQNGGAILDAKGQPAFDQDPGVQALTFWQQMARDDKSVYLDQTGQKFEQMFASGSIGMIMDGPWLLYTVKEAKLNYGTAILPGTNGDHQTISGPDLWVLFDHKDAQRAAAAYDFIHWLTAPEQDVRWNVAYGNLPLRKSAETSPEFATFRTDFPGGDVFFTNLDNAKQARPTVPGYQSLSLNVAKAINEVLVGGADPKTALHDAATASIPDLKDQ